MLTAISPQSSLMMAHSVDSSGLLDPSIDIRFATAFSTRSLATLTPHGLTDVAETGDSMILIEI